MIFLGPIWLIFRNKHYTKLLPNSLDLKNEVFYNCLSISLTCFCATLRFNALKKITSYKKPAETGFTRTRRDFNTFKKNLQ